MADQTDLRLSREHLFADQPQTQVLPNGLTLIYQQIPGQPLVSTQIWVKTGSIHEAPFLGSGLSHFLEHMLFKGTARRGTGAIASEVQAFGGQINAYTAYDRTVYYIDGPSEALGQSIDILCDMALGSTLPEDEVNREKEVILREIDMTLDDPDRILSRAFFETAFREHPYRYPVIGLKSLFEQVDRSVLSHYYEHRYRTDNMVLSVCGDFDEAELLAHVETHFGKVARKWATPLVLPHEPRQLAPRECRINGDYQIVRGLMGFKIPSLRDESAPSLDVIASILGSGYSGRLRQRLREELHLVHGVSASAWNPSNPGLFFIQYQCDSDKAIAAEKAILETLESLQNEPFTEQDLHKARQFALVGEIKSRQTASGLASRLGLLSALIGDLRYPEQFFETLASLTPESLCRTAAKTFRKENRTLATLLPKSAPLAKNRQKSSHNLPAFEMRVLPNGAKLLWQCDRRLPRTCIRFAGLGGPLYETPGQEGATSLLATLMTKDTLQNSAFDIVRNLENDGGFLVDSSGSNTYSLAVEVLPEFAQDGLRYLRDAALEPAFLESTLDREKKGQIAHIKEMHDEILEAGRIALRQRFFGNHAFASDPAGSVESVENIDRDALIALHRRLLVSENAVLVIAGDFDPDSLLPKAEAFLNNIPEDHFSRREDFPIIPATTAQANLIMDREQAVVFDAFPDVGIAGDEGIAAEVIDEILSDMSGPLFTSVREEQSLAYYVGAYRLLGYNHGSFILYAGTQTTSREAVFASFDKELERIRSGHLRPGELDAARTRLNVQNRVSLQSPANRAARVALNVLYNKPVMDWLEYEDKLNGLQTEDLVRYANTYLHPDKRLRLSIGPSTAKQG